MHWSPFRNRPSFLASGILAGLLACSGGEQDTKKAAAPPPQNLPTASCSFSPDSSAQVSVKDAPYNAKGDGATDDTAAIQAAVNAVGGTGGTVFVPAGTYMINAITAINMRSHMTLKLDPGATLQAITNGSANYDIIALDGVTSVNITGGTLLGDRATHTGTTGEWGHGISISASSHVLVSAIVSRECWGCGFYIGLNSKDVTLCGVLADHNRRQGVAITCADGVALRSSIFQNTQGTFPESGCDIEPNQGETVNSVLITGCTFSGNHGSGISSGVPIAFTGSTFVYNVVLDGNTCTSNGVSPIDGTPKNGIEISNSSGAVVKNNTCTANTGRGILFRASANNCSCTGNNVSGTLASPGDGIVEDTCSGNTLTGNTSINNAGHGVYSAGCTGSTISGNTTSGNGKVP